MDWLACSTHFAAGLSCLCLCKKLAEKKNIKKKPVVLLACWVQYVVLPASASVHWRTANSELSVCASVCSDQVAA